MKIAAYFKNNDDRGGSHSKDFRIFGIFPRIAIYNPYRSTMGTYSTTIHELAHASHWELRKNNWYYGGTSVKVKESWAVGVQEELTRMIYPNYKGRSLSTGFYTLVVVDMIDDLSTDSTNNGFTHPEDSVSGYTIKQIEGVLSNTSSWNDWRVNIVRSYTNSTEDNLYKLFRAYE